jgi:hypothetical protein
MLSDTRILLEQAINRLHEAEKNELEGDTKNEIRRIMNSIQYILDGAK